MKGQVALTPLTGQAMMSRMGFARMLLDLAHARGTKAPQESDFIVVAVPQGQHHEAARRIGDALGIINTKEEPNG